MPHQSAMTVEKQILLVEDEESIRGVWCRHFERWGFTFDMAGTGPKGLELARAGRYQILVTDLSIPGLPGEELIRLLRREQPELEIIVVTGQATVETAVEIMKTGVYEFLTKPINFMNAGLVLNNCLAHLISHSETERLRKLTEDLETLTERKEKFIAITNHELRTPVSVVKNVSELLQDQFQDGETRELVDILSRASRQLEEIVTQMHEISRAHSTGLALVRDCFPLAQLCQEVAGECWLILQQRRQHLVMNVSDQLFITADRGKFKKVIRELLHNAIKFTEEQGRITIAAEINGQDQMVFKVSDTGIGIQEEYQERIFELFYEVASSIYHSTENNLFGGGMGVGLSLVHEIVSAHQGTVEVASELGKGATFSVFLPQNIQPAP